MTAQKKAGAKTAPQGGDRLEVRMRFTAGNLTAEHAKALKDKLHRMVPEMVDKLANASGTSSGAFSNFQRTVQLPPTKPGKKSSGGK